MQCIMSNFVKTFECFHVHSAWNNGLVKFRDVEFEDACVLFYFCSVLIN